VFKDRKTAVVVATVVVLAAGLVATAVPIIEAAGDPPGYQPVSAQFAAAGVLLLLTAMLLVPIRERKVAVQRITWTDVENVQHQVEVGWLVPDAAVSGNEQRIRNEKVSAFRALYLGSDNRASTSKAVALAWTYAIAYGLLALLALKLMGDDMAWTTFQNNGLSEEYLLLLGGPYAAAVIAKYVNVATTAGDTKTSEPTAAASVGGDAKNLIANDEGGTDLGDFQYVLFNLVTLAFFFGTFIPDPREAFPELPSLLVGLALTSAATYAAKKAAVGAGGPQLTSLFPTEAPRDEVIDLFGRSLVADGGKPMISLDGTRVPDRVVDVVEQTTSRDHLKFKVPATMSIPAGTASRDCRVRLTTANGIEARAAGGAEFLTLTIT
jgi:hypothetical protein